MLEEDDCITVPLAIPALAPLCVCILPGTSNPLLHLLLPLYWFVSLLFLNFTLFFFFPLCVPNGSVMCEWKQERNTVNQANPDENLGGAALEAKRRLDEKFATHLAAENRAQSKSLFHYFAAATQIKLR